MRVIAVCSPSHEPLLDEWFLPTLPRGFVAGITDIDQVCATGEYKTDGWDRATLRKFDVIRQAIADHPGEVLLFSDLDVRFFDLSPTDLIGELGDCDVAFQRNDRFGEVCTGFFVFRACVAVSELVDRAAGVLEAGAVDDDQEAVNAVLDVESSIGFGRRASRVARRSSVWLPGLASRVLDRAYRADRFESIVRWRYLSRRFWTPGQEGSRNWRRGDALDLPAGVLVHHANWTKGLANKVSQLEAVDELVAERAGPG